MANKFSRSLPAAVLLLGGCASLGVQTPLGRAGHIGASLCPADGGLGVVSVAAGSPAEDAGLREGDVLTNFAGTDLTNEAGRKSLLWGIRDGSGKTLRLTVRRAGKTFAAKAVPAAKDTYPRDEIFAALSDEIMTGRKVAVAVIVTRVAHAKPEFFNDAASHAAWTAAMEKSVEGTYENMMLSKPLLRCGNYAVVDRDTTDRVLHELNFQMTGAVSAETAKQVGKMTGASHLLFVDFTRFQTAGGSYEDDSNVRLVTVETDQVAASVRFRRPVAER